MIHVYYSDGSDESYDTLIDAEVGIEESVLGCDFAATVDSVEDDKGNSYACTWSVKLCKEPRN